MKLLPIALVTLAPRKVLGMEDHVDFHPLSCNDNVAAAACTPWSQAISNVTSGEVFRIDCGTCVELDIDGDITIDGGIDIVGRLFVPPGHAKTSITLPFLFVQGELDIGLPDNLIPSSTSGIEFILTGTEDQYLMPHMENMMACMGQEMGCKVGKKPVAVAGGRVNIDGMNDSCPSWIRLADVVLEGAPQPANFEQAPTPKSDATCSSILVDEDFSGDTIPSNWDGHFAPTSEILTDGPDGSPYFSVRDRTSGYHGPRVKLDIDCIVPNEPYLLSLKYRLKSTTDATTLPVPWVKMIRKDVAVPGRDAWINPTWFYPRSAYAEVADDSWNVLEHVISFPDDQADSGIVNELYLYISSLEVNAVVDLDYFKLELAPPSLFHADSSEVCTDMISSDSSVGYTFPFYATGGSTYPSSNGAPAEFSLFMRWELRTTSWHTLQHELNTGCFLPGAVYRFNAFIRIHSSDPKYILVGLKKVDEEGATSYMDLGDCPKSSSDWVQCEIYFTSDDRFISAEEMTLTMRIPGDESSIADIGGVSFTHELDRGRVNALIPDDVSIASCWAPGGQVLVTSSTILTSDAIVAEIASVDPSTGALNLVEGIPRPTSLADDPMTGVEVALLDRNVRFIASDDDALNPINDGHGHGGHFIVLHTPHVDQYLKGAEMRGFGQQGNLGRYPIHFHMCGSVHGAVVEKNVIRNSNQRCVVLHGTDDVVLRDNVAFNTSGHCFMLEDGAEQGNWFERNLGASTRAVETRISDNESDQLPSTFWLTNPNNTWIDNVAAGSDGSGFWFEVMARVRGPSRMMFPDMEPRYIPLKLFTNNTSHTNTKGLHTYPQTGYRPTETAWFRNHKAYRNRGEGVFFHAGGDLGVDGGYFSDNMIAVSSDADHSDKVVNSEIIGVSDYYKNFLLGLGIIAYDWPWRANCREGVPVSGIGVDSYDFGGKKANGTYVESVTFSGFGPSSCPGAHAFYANDAGYLMYFDPRTTMKDIHFEDDSVRFNLCEASEYGIHDVAIRDVDGSVLAGPGFVISQENPLASMSYCSIISDQCAASCVGMCLRSLKILIPVHTSPDMELEVSGTDGNGEAIPVHRFTSRHHKAISTNMRWWSNREIYLTLPSNGNYSARFVENGSGPLWPGYFDSAFEDTPGECGPDFSLSLEIPEATCDEIIVNGDAGDGVGGSTAGWTYMDGDIQLGTGGADGTTYSLLSGNRQGSWYGIGQYLDTRCITIGSSYAFSAKIKLTKDGSMFECDVNAWSNQELSCPHATVRATYYDANDSIKEYDIVGDMIESDKEWNTMTGTFDVTSFQAGAGRVLIYIDGAPEGVDMHIDQVSLTLIEKVPTLAPSSSPTSSPTSAPTLRPTGKPTKKPTLSPVGSSTPDFHESNSLFTPDTVSFENGKIDFSAQSHGKEAVVVSSKPHAGVGDSDELEIKVKISNRLEFGSGYQAAVALFFAPQDAIVSNLAYNDNMYGAFESYVVSTVRDRLYPTIDHVWMAMHTSSLDGNGAVYQSGGDGYKMSSGEIKLRRSDGFVSAFISPDGQTWKQVGSSLELPDEFKTSPLKIGIRIKRDYASQFSLSVLPTIISDGQVDPLPPSNLNTASAFDSSNSDYTPTISFMESGFVSIKSTTGENTAIMTNTPHQGDGPSSVIEITVKMENRAIFGGGYQPALGLFFAPQDANLPMVTTNDNGFSNFQNYVVSHMRDKLYPTIDHLWAYMSARSPDGSTTAATQSGGQGYKNLSGYLRLRREDGTAIASFSPDGNTWYTVGTPMALPDEFKTSPLKIGMMVKKEWKSEYDMQVSVEIVSGGIL